MAFLFSNVSLEVLKGTSVELEVSPATIVLPTMFAAMTVVMFGICRRTAVSLANDTNRRLSSLQRIANDADVKLHLFSCF